MLKGIDSGTLMNVLIFESYVQTALISSFRRSPFGFAQGKVIIYGGVKNRFLVLVAKGGNGSKESVKVDLGVSYK